MVPVLLNLGLPSLKRTASLTFKMDGWFMLVYMNDFFLGQVRPIFRGNLFLVSGKVVEIIFESGFAVFFF